jgi:catechol 2,3-dioxygenase-like lactoylglutathione lyase family enzyme
MALTLNHYSIRTADINASRDFYERVLGLTVGPRPQFAFPGYWMYRGDHAEYANAVVHIIGISQTDSQGLNNYLGDRRNEAGQQGTGPLDHVAFFADGLAAMLDHLRGLGIAVRERTVPGLGLHQVFLNDPDGVVVELNYPAAEKIAMDAARVSS